MPDFDNFAEIKFPPKTTSVDPDWARQMEGLRSITEAINSAYSDKKSTFVVTSENCTIEVCADTGAIVKSTCWSIEATQFVAEIDRFDVDEAKEWVKQYCDATTILEYQFEINTIGFWNKQNEYIAAEEDYRQGIENGNRENITI
jgi:hypothetical protein